MTRKEQIRSEIAKLEQRKQELIEEVRKLPNTPAEVILYYLKKYNHTVYEISKQTMGTVFVHASLFNELTTITKSIYKDCKYCISGFLIRGDGSFFIWFDKYG